MSLLKNYRFVLLCMLVVVGVGISDLCAWKGAPFVWREWWCAALAALAAGGGFAALYKCNNRGGTAASECSSLGAPLVCGIRIVL